MFGNSSSIEESIEKKAFEAIKIAKEHNKDFNTAVREIADRYNLNNYEIERVCARVNHNTFNEKFAQQKTSTFKIAKYEEVINMNGNVSVEHDVNEFKTASEKMYTKEDLNTFNKVAMEQEYIRKGEIANHIFSSRKLAEFEHDALNNANDVGIMQNFSKDMLYKMKNHIVELVKLGETPESIEKMLLEVWGEDNKEEIEEYLKEVFQEINANYQNLQIKSASYKIYHADSKLQKLASDYACNMEKLVKAEYLHENYMDCLVYNGRKKEALEIDERIPTMSLIGLYLKNNAEKIAEKIAADTPTNTGCAPTSPQENEILRNNNFNFKNVAGTAAILSTAPIVAGLGAHGIGSMISSLRRSSMKKDLLNKFPELRNIDRTSYENIYDSLTGLEPSLTKAPYALAEMIKKHNEYGTIDSDTTLRLLGSNKQNLLGPSAVRDLASKSITEGVKGVMSNKNEYDKAGYGKNR